MDIEEKIRKLEGSLARVRPCHPARIPSWVAAAAVAAGLTVAGAACTTERHTETPAGDMTGMDPGPAVALYAGPPPQDMEAPENVPAYAGPPPEGDLYGGPPMDDEETSNPPPAPVPAYDGPPMR